jgi:hypothetical protein
VASHLYLATVVATFDGLPDSSPRERGRVLRDGLMAHPDVVTVRPDGEETRWLYRVDVEATGEDAAREPSTLPAAQLASRLGCRVSIERVSLMDEHEKQSFHGRFRGMHALSRQGGPHRAP